MPPLIAAASASVAPPSMITIDCPSGETPVPAVGSVKLTMPDGRRPLSSKASADTARHVRPLSTVR
ncbi:hypothetical protein [Sinomonas flava]|uniref:hypothetical protein n=1 Tax=Sinomonas flava TaxID=496857 RepID=UPI0039A48573